MINAYNAGIGGKASPELKMSDLSNKSSVHKLSCDVLVIGGGPAGMAVAQGLDRSGLDVLILESGGLEETQQSEELNRVVVDPANWTDEQVRRRNEYHGAQAWHWGHDRQGYGVRCRVLGGSTAAWAGKSAAFGAIDFAERHWVPNSGWPIDINDLTEALDRAAVCLNLSANCYDDRLWELLQRPPPEPRPDPKVLGSFFWQFARSRINPMDVMRFGTEFTHEPPRDCRVITGATVTGIITDQTGKIVTGVEVSDSSSERHSVQASTVVLAASAIENARLLLNSRTHSPNGLGNEHDVVGRYLMDHPCAVVAKFEGGAISEMARMFGFYGLRTPAGSNMYMRGLAPTEAVQEADGLLNCAAFMPGERAPDDPWDAVKRILKQQSENYASDCIAILKSPGLVTKGIGRLALQNRRFPTWLSQFIVDQVVRFKPSMAVEEFLTGGVPHKLTGFSIQVVTEQTPEPENRITLSDRKDRFGVPYPKAKWQVGDLEMRTISRFAEIIRKQFKNARLPPPILEEWVSKNDFEKAAVIDMAHSAGTTRMSSDPKKGVVDQNCKVHKVDGLYIAGASVFPTSGHANPTLMVVALAFRLADHLRSRTGLQ